MTTSENDAIFSALADPTRRAILSLIGEHEELTAGEIAANFDALGRTAVSSHLRILRLAGLVAERRDGRYRHYSVTSTPADAVVAFLTSVYQNSLEQLASAVQDAAVGDGLSSTTGTDRVAQTLAVGSRGGGAASSAAGADRVAPPLPVSRDAPSPSADKRSA